MTKIGGSSPTTPTPDSGSTDSTEGAAPKKPFEEVMGRKGDEGKKDGEKGDDSSKKKDDPGATGQCPRAHPGRPVA